MSVKAALLIAIGMVGAAPLLAQAAEGKPAPAAVAGGDWRESARKLAREHFMNPAWGYSHSARLRARERAGRRGQSKAG